MLIGGQGDKIVDGTDGRFRQSHSIADIELRISS
jgi:hypothetical protein